MQKPAWDSDPFEGHTDSVTSVSFSPDGCRVASGSHDRTIRIWDVETDVAPSDPFDGHASRVTPDRFTPSVFPHPADATLYPLRMSNTKMVFSQTQVRVARKLTIRADGDGWIRLSHNQLLLWVLPEYRNGLIDQSVMSMPANASVTLSCNNFCHGASWTKVKC